MLAQCLHSARFHAGLTCIKYSARTCVHWTAGRRARVVECNIPPCSLTNWLIPELALTYVKQSCPQGHHKKRNPILTKLFIWCPTFACSGLEGIVGVHNIAKTTLTNIVKSMLLDIWRAWLSSNSGGSRWAGANFERREDQSSLIRDASDEIWYRASTPAGQVSLQCAILPLLNSKIGGSLLSLPNTKQ